LICSFAVPFYGFLKIPFHIKTLFINKSDEVLCIRITLYGFRILLRENFREILACSLCIC